MISATRDHGPRSARSRRCVFAPGGRVRRWLLAGVVAPPMRATPKCLGGREVVDRQRLDPVLLRELAAGGDGGRVGSTNKDPVGSFVATSGQKPWPSVGSFGAAYGQFFMAADKSVLRRR